MSTLPCSLDTIVRTPCLDQCQSWPSWAILRCELPSLPTLTRGAIGWQVGIWSAITMAKIRPSRGGGDKGGGGGGKQQQQQQQHENRNDQANDDDDEPGGYDDDSDDALSSDLVSDSTDAEAEDDDVPLAAPRGGQHQQPSIGTAGR